VLRSVSVAPDHALVLRRVSIIAPTNLQAVAAEAECEISAIVQLQPFLVDQKLVLVIVSAASVPRCAELLVRLEAAVVRPVRGNEVLLGLHLCQPAYAVYMVRELLDHDEVMLCIDPPFGYATAHMSTLRDTLGARLI
jgi:hypothetical protein